MTAPEAYIQATPGLITQLGELTDKGTEQFLRDFMEAFGVFVTRVLTALPHGADKSGGTHDWNDMNGPARTYRSSAKSAWFTSRW
jgi:hypothetical protein